MLTAAILLLAAAVVSCAQAESINWTFCPEGQDGNDCASIPLPLDPDNSSNTAEVVAFVRRFYAGDAPTNKSLWMFAGGPGDSAQSFAGGAAYFISYDPSVTVYLMDQRGVGMSSPAVDCDAPPSYQFDPTNDTTIASYSACNAQISGDFGDELRYFGTYHAAVDYKTVVDMVAAEKVAIYAMSYGTYALNAYLQLDGARADVALMDGPVPPQRWALERDPEWKSRVAGDVLAACVRLSPTCSSRMGMGEPAGGAGYAAAAATATTTAHAAAFLMDAVVDGSLPCLAQLPWLTPYRAAMYNTAMLQGAQHVCLGPFWARVDRCDASDVEQLNHFHAGQEAAAAEGGPAPPLYSYGAAVNIGASEVFSFASEAPAYQPPTYAQLELSSQRVFATAGVELLAAHARDVDDLPRYTPDARTYRRFANLSAASGAPGVPLKILVGTLDPQTPAGLGPWFARGLGLDPADAVVAVPYACHGTVGSGDQCVLDMAAAYLFAFGQAPMNTTCLADIAAPDFEGTAARSTEEISMQYFGTPRLWNGMT